MNALEARLFELEKAVRNAQEAIRNLLAAVQALQQQPYFSSGGQTGGGGGSGIALFCLPSGGIAAASGGTPGGPLTGQTIELIASGAFSTVSTNASVYNAMGAAVVTTKLCAVMQNNDGTYSVISQSCI